MSNPKLDALVLVTENLRAGGPETVTDSSMVTLFLVAAGYEDEVVELWRLMLRELGQDDALSYWEAFARALFQHEHENSGLEQAYSWAKLFASYNPKVFDLKRQLVGRAAYANWRQEEGITDGQAQKCAQTCEAAFQRGLPREIAYIVSWAELKYGLEADSLIDEALWLMAGLEDEDLVQDYLRWRYEGVMSCRDACRSITSIDVARTSDFSPVDPGRDWIGAFGLVQHLQPSLSPIEQMDMADKTVDVAYKILRETSFNESMASVYSACVVIRDMNSEQAERVAREAETSFQQGASRTRAFVYATQVSKGFSGKVAHDQAKRLVRLVVAENVDRRTAWVLIEHMTMKTYV